MTFRDRARARDRATMPKPSARTRRLRLDRRVDASIVDARPSAPRRRIIGEKSSPRVRRNGRRPRHVSSPGPRESVSAIAHSSAGCGAQTTMPRPARARRRNVADARRARSAVADGRNATTSAAGAHLRHTSARVSYRPSARTRWHTFKRRSIARLHPLARRLPQQPWTSCSIASPRISGARSCPMIARRA